ncbi:MAG: hypothetical protein OEW09_17110, partial [Anaerolineae bacterium]|nr:hypothetical protein [Anaerolineae bacterium]
LTKIIGLWLPNYMFVDSHIHKRTYTRTLRIHCPTSPSQARRRAAISPGGRCRGRSIILGSGGKVSDGSARYSLGGTSDAKTTLPHNALTD